METVAFVITLLVIGTGISISFYANYHFRAYKNWWYENRRGNLGIFRNHIGLLRDIEDPDLPVEPRSHLRRCGQATRWVAALLVIYALFFVIFMLVRV